MPTARIRRRVRAFRWHRGRHEHRRGAAGAGGDEADLDHAARAAPPSTPRPASRRSRSTSARTSARCRPPVWSPRRWSRWCSPTRCWRSSAATRSPRPRRNVDGLPASGSPSAVAVRLTVSARASCWSACPAPARPRRPPAGQDRSALPFADSDDLIEAATGRSCREIFADRRRAGVPRARGRRDRRGAGTTSTACSRWAAAR